MKRSLGSFLLLGLALLALVAVAAEAKFGRTWEAVPVGRLVQNVFKYTQDHPSDAAGWYTLGRIHSIAYGHSKQLQPIEMTVRDWQTKAALKLPDFNPYETVVDPHRQPNDDLTKPVVSHLLLSIQYYRRATQLAPREALYFLGLGWMLAQGLLFTSQLGPPPGVPDGPPSGASWQDDSIAAYRKAYQLSADAERKKESIGPAEHLISTEAGEGILRLLGRRKLNADERKESAAIRAHIKGVNAKPHYITPIIFPLHRPASLAELLAGKTVRFDLSGECRNECWPWVGPDTGILVWDPERTGRITSGRQLFGSRTWQGIWRNGYEPLAALDDNGNGWLTGRELTGIAVWRDRNGNGRSDPGEVIPAETAGIEGIATHPTGILEGAPGHPAGIRWMNGATVATYDWTPESVIDAKPAVESRPSAWE